MYLHSCLDYINWCVPKHTGSPCHPSDQESLDTANVLGEVSTLDPRLQVCVDKEPNRLIGALFHDGGW